MRPDDDRREREAVAALGAGLRRVEPRTLEAIAAALDRDAGALEGGGWGSYEAGEGCLLSLAAWELGLPHGEALMRSSIAAVQLPALFDEAWAAVLRRTGDPEAARRVTQRLVRLAIASLPPARAAEPVAR